MRVTRIYQPGEFSPGEIIPLSTQASQHVGRVLRMKSGDNILLFNGNNYQFPAKIVEISKREVTVEIKSIEQHSVESNFKVHLGQCISKGDKMDLVMQKAVELGVTTITPIFSKFCNVNLDAKRIEKKHKQWQEQVISACEQSGRNYMPPVNFPCKIQNFIENCQAKHKLLLHPTANTSLHDYQDISNDVIILIGPEGGLAENEINRAEQCAFKPIKMGPRILRTETAAISALSVLQAIYGDL